MRLEPFPEGRCRLGPIARCTMRSNCSLENTIADALWFLRGVVVSLVCISASRMRHNSDEAEQPPNPSGWCSLVMNMSAASQRQTTTCGECAQSLSILRFSPWTIYSRLHQLEGLTTVRTSPTVLMCTIHTHSC